MGLMLRLLALTPLFLILAVYVELGGGLGWLTVTLWVTLWGLMRSSWKALAHRPMWWLETRPPEERPPQAA